MILASAFWIFSLSHLLADLHKCLQISFKILVICAIQSITNKLSLVHFQLFHYGFCNSRIYIGHSGPNAEVREETQGQGLCHQYHQPSSSYIMYNTVANVCCVVFI